MTTVYINAPRQVFESGMPASQSVELSRQLDSFLREVERRALRMAELSVGNREDALDLVQDAMLSFVRSYADRPTNEWAPLFYRVIDNRILDHHRRNQVRSKWLAWLPFYTDENETDNNPLDRIEDTAERGPAQQMINQDIRENLDFALKALPNRQRQAFLLRIWEGLDVADTARAMSCSEGSVKTHLSRAMLALRNKLEQCR